MNARLNPRDRDRLLDGERPLPVHLLTPRQEIRPARRRRLSFRQSASRQHLLHKFGDARKVAAAFERKIAAKNG
jgi:hypothetical protein